MIVNICRDANARWIVSVDEKIVPILPCRCRRSAILLAGEAGYLAAREMHALLEMDAREEATR